MCRLRAENPEEFKDFILSLQRRVADSAQAHELPKRVEILLDLICDLKNKKITGFLDSMVSTSTKKSSSKAGVPAIAAQARALGTWLSSQRTASLYGKAFVFSLSLALQRESKEFLVFFFFHHADIQDLGWNEMSKIPKNASWYSETRGQGHEQNDLKSEMNGDSESEQELEETLNEKAKELRWKFSLVYMLQCHPKGGK